MSFLSFLSDLDQRILHTFQSIAALWVKITNLSSYLLAFFLALAGCVCALVCLGQDLGAGQGPWEISIVLWAGLPMIRSLTNHDRWKDGKTPLDVVGDFSSFVVTLRVWCCLIAVVGLFTGKHWGGIAYFLVLAALYMSMVNSPPRQERRVFRLVPQTAC